MKWSFRPLDFGVLTDFSFAMAIADSHSEIRMPQATIYRQWPAPDYSPCTRMNWHELLFMHWPIAPRHLQSLLPSGVELDLYEGQAWIGVVPFRMSGVAARWTPPLPWVSRFPEVVVRTYVVVDGRPGIWYLSLDAMNRFGVFLAKCVFGLPYRDSEISLTRDGHWRRFQAKRSEDGKVVADLDVEYRPVGGQFQTEGGTLNHWLTARYCLYTVDRDGNILRGEIDHKPWKLQSAQAIIHSNTMTNSLGIALPDQCPHLLYANYNRVGSWRNQRLDCNDCKCS